VREKSVIIVKERERVLQHKIFNCKEREREREREGERERMRDRPV